MNWLSKYNNILFAILGTICIIFLFILAVSSLNLFSSFKSDNRGVEQEIGQPDSITITEEKDPIQYYLGTPELIDTSKSLYLIPVYKPEASQRTSKFSSSSYRSGLTVNLLIHDFGKNSFTKIFNSTVLIQSSDIIKTPEEIYIEIIFSEEDTNNNDIIDFDDLKSIGLYSVNKSIFYTIPLSEKFNTVSSTYDNKLHSLLIIGNKAINDQETVFRYFKYTLNTQILTELNNPL